MTKENSDASNADLLVSREERLALARKLTLMSDVFMSAVLDDNLACQHVIRTILNKPDLVVQSVRTQYEISKIISHGIRLDVLAVDSENRLYNIEIQKRDDLDHAKRTRYYSAVLDSEFLEKGGEYEDMPELHIIYISETDIWHGGQTIYHVEKELSGIGIPYEDGIYIHYVNAAVDDGSEIAKLMEYFKTTDPLDDSQGELSNRVQRLKGAERRDGVMCEAADKLMELGERIGEARGRTQGEARVNMLNQKLILENRYADLARSVQDAEFQKQLYEEFGL